MCVDVNRPMRSSSVLYGMASGSVLKNAHCVNKPGAPKTDSPAYAGLFREPLKMSYCRLAISASSADFGGRVSDSGSVANGSSTRLSRSVKVGFSVLM